MIRIEKLSKDFKGNNVIKDLDLEFEIGKTTVILGPSGCGKSTLFNILARLDCDYTGKIKIEEDISYIFQEDRLIPWLTTVENLKFIDKKVSDDRIEELLEKFKLTHKKDTLSKKLSGGEKQRLSIARGFLSKAKIILIDEALGSMDLSLKLEIIKTINTLCENQKKTMIVISHNVEEALLLGDYIYILDKNPMKLVEKIEIKVKKQDRNIVEKKLVDLEKLVLTKILQL